MTTTRLFFAYPSTHPLARHLQLLVALALVMAVLVTTGAASVLADLADQPALVGNGSWWG